MRDSRQVRVLLIDALVALLPVAAGFGIYFLITLWTT
jgi:hypothetical protein